MSSPIRPDQGIDLGLDSVIEVLHNLFDLVLVGLAIHRDHNNYCCLLSSSWLTHCSGGTWWHSGQASWKIFGLPLECLGLPEGGWHTDFFLFSYFFFLVAVVVFQHCLLGLPSLYFGFIFGRGSVFSFAFLYAIFMKRYIFILKLNFFKLGKVIRVTIVSLVK